MPTSHLLIHAAVKAMSLKFQSKANFLSYLSTIALTGVICVFLAIAASLAQDAGLPDWRAEVERLARSGNKILAIKLYREHTGVGLQEAKDAVNRLRGDGGGVDGTALKADGGVATPDARMSAIPPSIKIAVLPPHPKSTDTLNFILQGTHASGVSLMTLFIAGQEHSCTKEARCEFQGLGPFSGSTVTWTAKVRANDGTEVSQSRAVNLTVTPQGNCTISGKVAGPSANLAPEFKLFLWGPNDLKTRRASASFDASGRYRFEQLPAGRYDVTSDTKSKADTPHGLKPARHSFQCQPGANLTGDYELP